jgi:hypothetical protein
MQQPFAEDEIDAEFDGAVRQLRESESKRVLERLQEKAQRVGVGGLSNEEKQQYLSAISARGGADRAV